MKERPERKVIFEITGDGLTAEEVGRIRQVIRHLNYDFFTTYQTKGSGQMGRY